MEDGGLCQYSLKLCLDFGLVLELDALRFTICIVCCRSDRPKHTPWVQSSGSHHCPALSDLLHWMDDLEDRKDGVNVRISDFLSTDFIHNKNSSCLKEGKGGCIVIVSHVNGDEKDLILILFNTGWTLNMPRSDVSYLIHEYEYLGLTFRPQWHKSDLSWSPQYQAMPHPITMTPTGAALKCHQSSKAVKLEKYNKSNRDLH